MFGGLFFSLAGETTSLQAMKNAWAARNSKKAAEFFHVRMIRDCDACCAVTTNFNL